MAAGDELTLGELRDRAAIRDLLMRYGHAVDRRDFDRVAACFTPDAGYAGSLGEGDIAGALRALRERMQRFESTMHFISTQVIELAGDRARCETYALVYHRTGSVEEGEQDLIVGVRYLDELVRHSLAWRICRRVAKVEWQRFDTVVLPPES
jgi:hypothetical protein